VSNLINALEGAAVNAAAGASAGAAASPAASTAPVAEAPAAAVVIETPQVTPEVAVAAGTGVDPTLSEQVSIVFKSASPLTIVLTDPFRATGRSNYQAPRNGQAHSPSHR
jgi:hypothetical protein